MRTCLRTDRMCIDNAAVPSAVWSHDTGGRVFLSCRVNCILSSKSSTNSEAKRRSKKIKGVCVRKRNKRPEWGPLLTHSGHGRKGARLSVTKRYGEFNDCLRFFFSLERVHCRDSRKGSGIRIDSGDNSIPKRQHGSGSVAFVSEVSHTKTVHFLHPLLAAQVAVLLALKSGTNQHWPWLCSTVEIRLRSSQAPRDAGLCESSRDTGLKRLFERSRADG